jgi:hypothetical protein
MKWYNYLACFFAGVFLIHVVPHLLGGMSAINVAGVLVSLGGGGLLLWVGRFSFRNVWAIVLVVMGMVAVLTFAAMHPHHVRTAGGRGTGNYNRNCRPFDWGTHEETVRAAAQDDRLSEAVSLGGGRLTVGGRQGRC